MEVVVVVVVVVAAGWGGLDAGRSSGEDGLSMDLALMEGGWFGRVGSGFIVE